MLSPCAAESSSMAVQQNIVVSALSLANEKGHITVVRVHVAFCFNLSLVMILDLVTQVIRDSHLKGLVILSSPKHAARS